MHVRLYRRLQLTADERARLAAHWKMWRQHNTALDAAFHCTLQVLQRLLQPDDVPAAFASHVSAIAAGTRAATARRAKRRAARTTHARARNEALTGSRGGGHGQDDADGAPRSEALHAWVWRVVEGKTVLPLLGASAQATVVASQAFLRLAGVHQTHSRIRGELKELQLEPGMLLGPLKMACVLGANVVSGAAPADMMQLCQLAAAQQRWYDTFKPPDYVSRPLPEYEWLQPR